jgi:hypothetical protein
MRFSIAQLSHLLRLDFDVSYDEVCLKTMQTVCPLPVLAAEKEQWALLSSFGLDLIDYRFHLPRLFPFSQQRNRQWSCSQIVWHEGIYALFALVDPDSPWDGL